MRLSYAQLFVHLATGCEDAGSKGSNTTSRTQTDKQKF